MKDKFAQLQHLSDNTITVGLKTSPNVDMGEVSRIKELLRMLYTPQKVKLNQDILTE